MKQFIQSLLGKVGYEIRRKNSQCVVSRHTMAQGINWLSANNFLIETVLDVGASDGRWSKGCMACFTEAKYVLFEPQPVHSKH
ncbi:MAG: hypothetical protein D3909_07895 [Candidatus Electrothrix sp. ATG1]|nr:hypothetical protein [Candidatus Electrothrix sp. ATG1]